MTLTLPSRTAPASPPVRRVIGRAVTHRAVAFTAFGVLCAVALWLRLPAIARGTFWAEDGRNFISNAATQGWGALFRPYTGYLHTVPRLLALAVVTLPVPTWAVATTASCCAVTGILAVVVFACTRDIVQWMPGRVMIAALTVLAPLGPREVFGNLANLHSVFLWALFWVVLARPRTRVGTGMLSAVALLGALTEIQALALVPLLFTRPHDRRRWVVRAGLLVGLAAQVLASVVSPRRHNPDALIRLPSLAYGYIINAATPLAVPQRFIGPVLAATGPAIGILVLAVVLAAAGYAVARGNRVQGTVAVAAVALSMLLYAVDVEVNPLPLYHYAALSRAGLDHVWLVRYGVVPSMLLAAMVPLAASVAVQQWRTRSGRVGTGAMRAPRGPRRTARVMTTATAVLAMLVLVQFPPQHTRRWNGPEWRPQIAAAADTCADTPGLATVGLKETLGWTVVVPCRMLTD